MENTLELQKSNNAILKFLEVKMKQYAQKVPKVEKKDAGVMGKLMEKVVAVLGELKKEKEKRIEKKALETQLLQELDI